MKLIDLVPGDKFKFKKRSCEARGYSDEVNSYIYQVINEPKVSNCNWIKVKIMRIDCLINFSDPFTCYFTLSENEENNLPINIIELSPNN